MRERQVQICLSEMSLWRQRGVIEGLKLEAGWLSAVRQLVRTRRQRRACALESNVDGGGKLDRTFAEVWTWLRERERETPG